MYGRFPPQLGKIVVGLVAMSFAVNGWGEWKSCKDGFEGYSGKDYLDTDGNITSDGSNFQKKYCVQNNVRDHFYCGEVGNGAASKNYIGVNEQESHCINCNDINDCEIDYKVVLENNSQGQRIDPYAAVYAVYAKLREDKGDESENSDGTDTYTTCPKCSETLLLFKASDENILNYNLFGGTSGSPISGNFGLSKKAMTLSHVRYTKIGTITYSNFSTLLKKNDLNKLRAKLKIESDSLAGKISVTKAEYKKRGNIPSPSESYSSNQQTGASEATYHLRLSSSPLEASEQGDKRFNTKPSDAKIDAHNEGSVSSIDIERKDIIKGDKHVQDACCEIVLHGIGNDEKVFPSSPSIENFKVKVDKAVKDGVYGKWEGDLKYLQTQKINKLFDKSPTNEDLNKANYKAEYSVCRSDIPKGHSGGTLYDDQSIPRLSPRKLTAASVLVYGLTDGRIDDIEWELRATSSRLKPITMKGLSFDLEDIESDTTYHLVAKISTGKDTGSSTPGEEIKCSMRFKTTSEVLAATFQRAADCRIFKLLRDYYKGSSAPFMGSDYFYRKGGTLQRNEATDKTLTHVSDSDDHVVIVVRAKNLNDGKYNSILACGEFNDVSSNKPYGRINFTKRYSGDDASGTNVKKDQLVYFQACLVQDKKFDLNKCEFHSAIKNCTNPIPFAFNACPTISDWNYKKNPSKNKLEDDLLTSLGLCLATKEFTYGQLRSESVEGVLAIPPLPLWYPSVGFSDEYYPLNLHAARFNPEACQVVEDPQEANSHAPCFKISDELFDFEEDLAESGLPPAPVASNTKECTFDLAKRFQKREDKVYGIVKSIRESVSLDALVSEDPETKRKAKNALEGIKKIFTETEDEKLVDKISKVGNPNAACVTDREVYISGKGALTFPVCPIGEEVGDEQVIVSPLILDIAGKGINISRTFAQAVSFDMWGRQEPMLVDWPLNTSEVAFLVLPNKKGKVNSVKELFGNYKARNGFVALAKHDHNQDGQIDQKDKIYARLRLWFDRNRNGVCDKGELSTLAKHGVARISLAYGPVPGQGVARREKISIYYDTRSSTPKNVKDVYFVAYGPDGEPLRSMPKSSARRAANKNKK